MLPDAHSLKSCTREVNGRELLLASAFFLLLSEKRLDFRGSHVLAFGVGK